MGNDPAPQNGQNVTQTNQTNTNVQPQQVQFNQDEQYFLVEQINRIKLKNTENDILYFWIDPRIYNDQNCKNLQTFQQKLKLQQFSSIGSLQNQVSSLDTNNVIIVISAASLPDQNYKALVQQKKINQIVLFCQNQERAKLLMSNFPKITKVGYTSNEVLEIVKSISAKYPQIGPMKNTALFMTEDDTGLMNKYRLNYYCLTKQKNKSSAKKQFAQLATKLYPEQKSMLSDFTQNYSLEITGQQRRKQTLEWVFKDSFYWSLVQNLPKMTTDPRRLAYLRMPVQDIYQTIFNGYKEMKKKASDLFIVVELNEDEKQKLNDNADNFMIFTTFVKGFTDEQQANKQFKKRGAHAFKFDILQAKKLHQSLDFGYLQSQNKQGADIIFNIYNFFKICDVSAKARRATLEYGSLSEVFKLREDPNARIKMKPHQKNLLRNYDYLEDLMKKIKNQGSILQLSGYFKESIQIYDRKLEQITRTNKPAAMLDQYRIQKGDALKMNQQYQLAEKVYMEVQSQKLRLVAKIRLIQLFFMRQNAQKVDQMIAELENQIDNLKNWGFSEDYFRAKNYVGLNLMKKQKFKEANKYYKSLRAEISAYYDYRVEGIPLVHEIYRNLALSQTKINNHEEALNLLNSTKSWQQSSQGKGPTLILTERMIQNVHYSKGDKDGIQESKHNIEHMQKTMIQQSSVNINFIDASRGAIKVQQSIQQSMVNIDLEGSNSAKKSINIDQSTVNIDI